MLIIFSLLWLWVVPAGWLADSRMCPPHTPPGGYWVFSVVTAYNEGGEEMADTLTSMWDQAQTHYYTCTNTHK
eukprot:scaffold83385_cov21-Prasinocladus_malaysianus.AAC.1